MDNKDERKMILADLVSRDSAHNGYYEKLGILKLMNEARNSKASVLNNLREKIDAIDVLIKDYQLAGNDLNNDAAFEVLQTKVNKIFKSNIQTHIVLIVIVIVLLIIFL